MHGILILHIVFLKTYCKQNIKFKLNKKYKNIKYARTGTFWEKEREGESVMLLSKDLYCKRKILFMFIQMNSSPKEVKSDLFLITMF